MAIGNLNSSEDKLAQKLEEKLGQTQSQEVVQERSPVPDQKTNHPTTIQTNEQTNEVPEVQRKETRHSFDIFADQMISIKEIQLNREKTQGKKYRIGDLAKEAFDLFIANERNKK